MTSANQRTSSSNVLGILLLATLLVSSATTLPAYAQRLVLEFYTTKVPVYDANGKKLHVLKREEIKLPVEVLNTGKRGLIEIAHRYKESTIWVRANTAKLSESLQPPCPTQASTQASDNTTTAVSGLGGCK